MGVTRGLRGVTVVDDDGPMWLEQNPGGRLAPRSQVYRRRLLVTCGDGDPLVAGRRRNHRSIVGLPFAFDPIAAHLGRMCNHGRGTVLVRSWEK